MRAARDGEPEGPWSATWHFTTSQLTAPTLIALLSGATDVPVQPSLEWGAVPHAEFYAVEVALDAGFSQIVYTQAGLTGTSHRLER